VTEQDRQPAPTEGLWPRALKRFAYDLLPASKAPQNDGAVAPNPTRPTWISQVSALPGALESARLARENAEAGVEAAENKAARLVQLELALLTGAIALGSYQLELVIRRSWPWWFCLLPVVLALLFLGLGVFEAIQIDRVGFYSQPEPEDLIDVQEKDTASTLLAEEERGRFLASWTSRKKHSDLMQAKAWFTRGLAALVLAGALAAVMRANIQANPTPQPRVHSTELPAGPWRSSPG
jgi:hypothetical protein